MPTLDDLHRQGMQDPEYRRAWAEERLLSRVAINFVHYRKEHGLTQEQLAERLGRGQSFVAYLEAGDKNLTLRTLARFAEVLGIDPVELVQPLPSERPIEPADSR
jgi:transcriptional regulator with XRE-family HTH domain